MADRYAATTVASAILAVLVTACGTSNDALSGVVCPPPPPTVAVTPAPAVSAAATPKPAKTAKPPAGTATPKPTASGASAKPAAAATPKPDEFKTLFEPMQALYEAANSYTCVAQVVDNNKNKPRPPINSTLKISHKGPGSYRIDMVKTTNPITQGGKIVFTYGASTAKLRPGGILGLAVLTMPMNDDKLTTGCDWRLDQIVAKGLVDRLATGYTDAVMGQMTVGSDAVTVLKMTCDGDNSLDDDIEYEQLGIDGNHRLRYWAAYAKAGVNVPGGLLMSMTLEPTQFDVPLADSDFNI